MKSRKGVRPFDKYQDFYWRKAKVMSLLTEKQTKFCYEWVIHRSDIKAAVNAGYANSRLGAYETRNKPHVREFIGILLEEKMRVYEITLDNIFRELAKIAFSNSFDYISFTPDGQPYVDLTKVTPEQAAALSEITVDDYVDGRGDEARDVKKVRIKLHDKRSALVDLAKFKMIMEAEPNKYHTIDGKGEIIGEKLTDNERRRRIARLLGLEGSRGIGQVTDVQPEPANVDPEPGAAD